MIAQDAQYTSSRMKVNPPNSTFGQFGQSNIAISERYLNVRCDVLAIAAFEPVRCLRCDPTNDQVAHTLGTEDLVEARHEKSSLTSKVQNRMADFADL